LAQAEACYSSFWLNDKVILRIPETLLLPFSYCKAETDKKGINMEKVSDKAASVFFPLTDDNCAATILLTGQFVTDQSVILIGGTDMQKLSRRERERQNRRDQILQAAWEVFSSKDYDSATIDEVADAAELSKGTVYLYFQNKADLFLSTVAMGMERLSATIQEAVSSSSDPAAGLREVIRCTLDFHEKNAGFFKILSSEQAHFDMHTEMRDGRNFKKSILAEFSRNVDMLADYIRRGIEIGVFKQVNPEDAASVLLSAARGFVLKHVADPGSVRLSEKVDTIAAILLDGLRKSD
jgi:TetR/AcrR family fatty acid metabolism transcriptional regulator